ncbi:hypothetical protein FN846DRAFT_975911 [Sphaerosporella brunnea]|uniref:Uncharacterized protein n=1 Tax=Sphaerosporella brunnea TaxID=1250544 RepID=A0A5J5EEK9_9PEZI|nr:hypothetical protein FN846DRAFT_975911 [Sphaerosporella brunnea]
MCKKHCVRSPVTCSALCWNFCLTAVSVLLCNLTVPCVWWPNLFKFPYPFNAQSTARNIRVSNYIWLFPGTGL